jgi:hypothetical protein
LPPAIDTQIVIGRSAASAIARRSGLFVSLEFLPWCPIANLAKGLEIVEERIVRMAG